MYELFDKNTTEVITPTGKKMTIDDLEKDFPLIKTVDYVAVFSDGILHELTQLSVLKSNYYIEESDPNIAVEKINEMIKATKPDPITLSKVQSQADDNTAALAEIGVMTEESMTSDADLFQAVGELGVKIAELSAKLDALQQ